MAEYRLDQIDPIIVALRAERERRGLSMQALGEQLGRSTYQTVWQWESGTCDLRLSSLRQWAAQLGFDVVLAPRPEVTRG